MRLVIFSAVVTWVRDGCRVQHIDQTGKTFGAAIVWGRRQHNQRIRAGGEQLGQLAALAVTAALGHIVGLVDDNHIPVRVFKVVSILKVLLESIDRDNRLVDIVKRVVIARYLVAQALYADAVE